MDRKLKLTTILCVIFLIFAKDVNAGTYRALLYFPQLIYNIKGTNKVEKQQEVVVEEVVEPTFTLSVAGDTSLGYYFGQSQWNRFDQVADANGYSYFMEKVKPIFEQDDITLVNLEGPLTTGGTMQEKKFAIKGEPSYSKILKEGSIEVVNLANNHTYDYGEEGYRQTKQALDKESIGYFGGDSMYYKDINGIKVAFIGAKGWSNGKWVKDPLTKLIKEANQKADIVIAMFHWGEEGSYSINSIQKDLAYYVIDQGVDLVVGSHPHNIQGIETYKGKNIVYSLGNFSFGANRNPEDKATFIFQETFKLTAKGIESVESKVIPCRISSKTELNNYQPIPLEGKEKEDVLGRLKKYSETLTTSYFK